jgi:hypothetical protein
LGKQEVAYRGKSDKAAACIKASCRALESAIDALDGWEMTEFISAQLFYLASDGLSRPSFQRPIGRAGSSWVQ